MERDNKQVNWLPFFSICSVFIVLGTVGWLLKIDATPFAIGFSMMAGLTVITQFLPPEFSFKNYWYSAITSEAHIILIVLATICSIFLIFFVIPQYDFNFSVKRKNE